MCRPGHTLHNTLEQCCFKTLFDKHIQCEIKGRRTGDSKIINGAMHSERPDITTGKFEGLYRESVCRDNDFAFIDGYNRRISLGVQVCVAKMAKKNLPD